MMVNKLVLPASRGNLTQDCVKHRLGVCKVRKNYVRSSAVKFIS